MPIVEVFQNDDDAVIFVGNFDFLPRVGETISKDVGGYFSYYKVIEVWHREEGEAGRFRACISVKLND